MVHVPNYPAPVIKSEGLPDYYHGTKVRSWAGTSTMLPHDDYIAPNGESQHHPPLNPAQFQDFFHASDNKFRKGDVVKTAQELNPENPEHAAANPFADPGERDYDTTFATTNLDAAKRWGGNLYRVQPQGAVFADRTGTTPHDVQVHGHLKVLGRVSDGA